MSANEIGVGFSRLPLQQILLKRKSLRRQLASEPGLHPLRVAVLGGSTTQEFADLLELQLLASGFLPQIYQSDYGRFETESLHDPVALLSFRPEIIYLHTSVLNLSLDKRNSAEREVLRFEQIWAALGQQHPTASLVQNTFELPPLAVFGNLDLLHGQTARVNECNRTLVEAAKTQSRIFLNDVHSLSARIGLDRWFDPVRYFSSKIVTTPEGSQALACSVAAIIRGIYGKARKVLVLDLDNTLWGGVIGDDGLERIQIGQETPVAQAYAAFQRYCLALRDRGILLAVCSKNDDAVARSGFYHPDSLLKIEHFAAFRANWQPKPDNLVSIAAELQLGLESFVFVDDNPAERSLVRAQLPQVAVPELTADVTEYPYVLDRARYFEPVALSPEDLARAQQYQQNLERHSAQGQFADYGAYLDSLAMRAEIGPFTAIYLDRIAQLTNKTNQFNLTTHRYSRAELEALAADPGTVTLYARLTDRFGDNGLVSVILGRRLSDTLMIDLWLMSCRVLKRSLELAMLDELVAEARHRGAVSLTGVYIPSRKNSMVSDHYAGLGFTQIATDAEGTVSYSLALADYQPGLRHIAVQRPQSGS